MTAVDRAPSLASSRSLQSDFQQDQTVATFPIAPLVMTSPTGMRRERRKAAPSWPDSPRGGAGGRSDRDVVDLDSPGYLQTPSILRNIPPPTATPTHKQFLHTPVTAGYASPFFSSAPTSNARGEPVASSSKQPLPSRDRKRQEGIPKSYFVKSLHNLAPTFWNKPATADCRVLIPVRGPGQMTPSPTHYASFKDNYDHDVTSQRPQSSSAAQLYGGVSPALVNTGAFASTQTEERPGTSGGPDSKRKLMTFNLHRDYLISQSVLFQELLEGRTQPPRSAAPHQSVPPSAPSDVSTFARNEAAGRSSSPRRQVKTTPTKGARVLHTPAHVPTTVWLPLPDPGSFAVLAHVLYWGDASVLETALARGEVTWQGVVKNTEYLGFDNAIKRILGSWFRRWVKVSGGRQARAQSDAAIVGRRQSGKDGEMSDDDADFFGPASAMPRRRSENNVTVQASSAKEPVMEGVEENVDAEVVANMMQGL